MNTYRLMPYVGERVQIHPATDAWMRGERYGTVVQNGGSDDAPVIYVKVNSGRTRRFAAELVLTLDGSEPYGNVIA